MRIHSASLSGIEAARRAGLSQPTVSRLETGRASHTTITSNVQEGKAVQRVHVVLEPLTDYLRFELTWGYEPNVAAGEDIRIIPVGQDDPWPEDVPHHDYWLFDSAGLYDMHYDNDGVWLGVEHVADPVKIVDACRWRDAALHLGTAWATYVRSKSQLTPHLSLSSAS